jgi:23S rRNA (guanosine2251-2'-O)-methyltransferase
MTAGAWKASAGAAAHLQVAQATNLGRELRSYQEAGVFIVGLDGSGDASIADKAAVDLLAEPVCVVVGSEGKGLSHVVRSACDLVARIPISDVESLNVGVAASITLYEAARARSK